MANLLLKRIKDWAKSITSFRTGDVIPVDGPSGTAKMSKDDLLRVTAENSLNGGVSSVFDSSRDESNPYKAGELVTYEGETYQFLYPHYGDWSAYHVKKIKAVDSINLSLCEKRYYPQGKERLYIVDGRISLNKDYISWITPVSTFDANKLLFVKNPKNDNRYTSLAFLKSAPIIQDNEPVDFCEGESLRVVKNGDGALFQIPTDCEYVIMYWYIGEEGNFPFEDMHIYSPLLPCVSERNLLKEVKYQNVAAVKGEQVVFNSAQDVISVIFDVSGCPEFYINYNGQWTSSLGYSPVMLVDKDYKLVRGLFTIPDNQITHIHVSNERFFNLQSDRVKYVVMSFAVNNDNEKKSFFCNVSTNPFSATEKSFTRLSPSSYQIGKFWFRGKYVSQWRFIAEEYNVAGLDFVIVDQCIDVESDGPYRLLLKLSDNTIMPVWGSNAYSQYDGKNIVYLPSNAVSIIVNSSEVEPNKPYYRPRVFAPSKYDKNNVSLFEIENEKKNIVNLFFIGNSLTQDAVSYLPLLLREVCPGLEFNIYIWYNGGYTLKQQWENKIQPDADCEIFSSCHTDITWKNASLKMSNILSYITFERLILQEYFNYVDSYTAADVVYFNNIVNHIASVSPCKFEVDCLFHAPKRGENFESIYTMTKNGNIVILKNTPAVDIFVPGCAVYEACKTALDNLGDLGHLSPDGTHTQEGLPCLLQAYVMLLQVLNKLGKPMSVEGVTSVVDNTNYSSIDVPGPNLGNGVVVGTSSDYELAKQVAASACNKRFAILSETF